MDKQDLDPSTSEAPYLGLLGIAYQVPLNNRSFEAFLDAAHDFFSSNLQTGSLDETTLSNRAAMSALDEHIDRLEKIFDMAMAEEKASSDDLNTYHAVLHVSAEGAVVSGNSAAEELMNCSLPTRLENLPLDFDSRKFIQRSLTSPSDQDRIFLANIGKDENQSYMGLVQKAKDETSTLSISLSYVHWTDNLLVRVGKALGLTQTETQVLEGYLKGKTPKQIATQRKRSQETIKAQSKNILRKVGCARIADVVQLAAGTAYMLKQMPDTAGGQLHTLDALLEDRMETMTRCGRTIAYYKHGDGERFIVFLHALIQGPFFSEAFKDTLGATNTTLLAPSRPSYGYTSKSPTEREFDETALKDALAVIDKHTKGPVHIVALQLGTSHAARLANALNQRAASLILINGGIPQEKKHYAGMDRRVRFAAMSARYAPTILKMSNTLGLRAYKERGSEQFIMDRYCNSPIDKRALSSPEAMDLHVLGADHAAMQDGAPFLLDILSKHADWSADLGSGPLSAILAATRVLSDQ